MGKDNSAAEGGCLVWLAILAIAIGFFFVANIVLGLAPVDWGQP